ncbi:hypothetical protein RR46_09885 [Papilio xuthus]|uniref:Uncharacterized protein n=1 Tax=Papilio xuthus TaxID=66420 RepID=A0A194QB42_PAPXU|nr:hypothetical protein RR46_09885 [Papilio xuthus]
MYTLVISPARPWGRGECGARGSGRGRGRRAWGARGAGRAARGLVRGPGAGARGADPSLLPVHIGASRGRERERECEHEHERDRSGAVRRCCAYDTTYNTERAG